MWIIDILCINFYLILLFPAGGSTTSTALGFTCHIIYNSNQNDDKNDEDVIDDNSDDTDDSDDDSDDALYKVQWSQVATFL